MTVNYTLSIDTSIADRQASDLAFQRVTDTTRRVLNRATVLTPVDTGRLRAANMSRVRRVGLTVTGEVWNDTTYAAPVHDGSKAHTIRPRFKKALRFTVDGQTVFARSARIPARKGRPWLLRALREIAGPEGYRIVI